MGFEPMTSWSQTRRASQTAPRPVFVILGERVRLGTPDLLFYQLKRIEKFGRFLAGCLLF